jgi:hypothetical protein
VAEHPGWEDRIVVENLSVRLEDLDACLDGLQGDEVDRFT